MAHYTKAGEHKVEEIKHQVEGKVDEMQRKDKNAPITDRASAGMREAGHKIGETYHSAAKDSELNKANAKVNHQVEELKHGAQYEADMGKAKNPNEPVTTRAGAGLSAVGDKIQEKYHETMK